MIGQHYFSSLAERCGSGVFSAVFCVRWKSQLVLGTEHWNLWHQWIRLRGFGVSGEQ